MSEFETALNAAHHNLHEYVHLHNALDFDAMLQPMRATTQIDTGLKKTYVIEMTTDSRDPGKVFLRTKHWMGHSVPFSDRTVFFPHPHLPAGRTQTLSPDNYVPVAASFKRWDINEKARKALTKDIGLQSAREQLPPIYHTWKQRNPKVIKEMEKIAAGGYACHILTPAQKVETTQMLAAIVDDPSCLPIDRKFACPSLWTLWQDAQGQPVPTAPPEDNPIPAAPVAQAPEVRPVMQYGLTNAQQQA
jgi:hypothetical protein